MDDGQTQEHFQILQHETSSEQLVGSGDWKPGHSKLKDKHVEKKM